MKDFMRLPCNSPLTVFSHRVKYRTGVRPEREFFDATTLAGEIGLTVIAGESESRYAS